MTPTCRTISQVTASLQTSRAKFIERSGHHISEYATGTVAFGIAHLAA